MSTSEDPTRWSDDPSAGELGAAVRAAQSRGPDASQLAAMAKALGVGGAAVAVSTSAVSAAATAGATGTVASTSGTAIWLSVGALTVAVGAGVWGLRATEPQKVEPVTQHAAQVEAPQPEALDVVVPPEVVQAPPVAPRQVRAKPKVEAPPQAPIVAEPVVQAPPAAPQPPPPDRAALLRAEAELVRRAESALVSDPSRALALFEEHRTRFTEPAMAQEASVVAIDALLRLGRVDEAEKRANVFLAEHPRSIHARRVRQLLENHR